MRALRTNGPRASAMTRPVANCEARLLHGVQQRPQMGHFPLKELGAPFPLLERVILLLEAIDLVKGGDIELDALHGAARLDGREGRGLEQGGGQIDQTVAGVGDHAVADAAQHQQDGA